MISRNRFKNSFKAFWIHFSISIMMAFFLWILIEKFWYPYPYLYILGGANLFFLLISADVVCGPVLTAVVFHSKKNKKENFCDISVIVLIQLGALVYGIHSLYLARPIAVVYEVDRFVAVSKVQLNDSKINLGTKEFQEFSSRGPIFVGIRKPTNDKEKNENMELSISGVEPSARPSWWQSYDLSRLDIIARMHSVDALKRRLPDAQLMTLQKDIEKIAIPVSGLYYLPLVSFLELDGYIVILNESADVVGYSSINGWL